jgi:hypothetical protein
MAYDTIEVGPTPCYEECEQVGPNYRPEWARRECRAYIGQLKRIHGEPPEGAYYRVLSCPHDFGTYHEVGIRFDDRDPEAIEYAFKVEGDTPDYWDDLAMIELDRARCAEGGQPAFADRLVGPFDLGRV